MGNQRRLKYAPPPDLTTTSQQHYQPPTTTFSPYQSNLSTFQPIFPPTDVQPVLSNNVDSIGVNEVAYKQSNSAPPLPISNATTQQLPININTLQDSSYHGSSGITTTITTPTSYVNCVPPPPSSTLTFQSQPRAIPTRLVSEPATPQNTPADVAYSGFGVYRQQHQQQQQQHQQQQQQELTTNLFGFDNNENGRSVSQLEAIQEIGSSRSNDKTFSPISAARVTEKLENFIAAEQNDDTLSVKSELSAEVAKITAGIVDLGKEKIPVTEELTEIDLKAVSDNFDNLVSSVEEANVPELPKIDYSSNLFDSTIPILTSHGSNFYDPSFSNQQQAITDPFSFVKPAEDNENTVKVGAQSLNAHFDEPQIESSVNKSFSDNVDLAPSSIWEPSNQFEVIFFFN